jgi:DNA-binding NarL/FixJ family response regulator
VVAPAKSSKNPLAWDATVRAVEYRLVFEMVRARIRQAIIMPERAEACLKSALDEIEVALDKTYASERTRHRFRDGGDGSGGKWAKPPDRDMMLMEGAGKPGSDPSIEATEVVVKTDGSSPLSPRETEVLESLANGYTVLETTERLHIAHATFKRHLQNASHKLNAPGIQEHLVAIAIRSAWIFPDVGDEWNECPIPPDELVIVRHLAMGFAYDEIAKGLGISETTAKARVRRACTRIGEERTNKPRLVAVALMNGWIT